MQPFKLYFVLFYIFFALPICTYSQVDSNEKVWDDVIYDTATVDVFEGAENASFKLDYYHTDGYSTGDRYWYEVVILDSLMILNFKSPNNDSWNYISYQKQMVLDDSTFDTIKSMIKTSGIGQKIKGIPRPAGSGYGADKLFIQTKDISIAGGLSYMFVNDGDDGTEAHRLYLAERKQTSSLSGDYETLFTALQGLFTSLPFLLKDMNNYSSEGE